MEGKGGGRISHCEESGKTCIQQSHGVSPFLQAGDDFHPVILQILQRVPIVIVYCIFIGFLLPIALDFRLGGNVSCFRVRDWFSIVML